APYSDASLKNLAGTISGGKGTAYSRRKASARKITSPELISPPPTAIRAGSIKIARLATWVAKFGERFIHKETGTSVCMSKDVGGAQRLSQEEAASFPYEAPTDSLLQWRSPVRSARVI